MSIREQLQNEIEQTRARYHALLARVPVEAYAWPSDNPAWSIGEVLYHMSLAPRLMVADVRMITGPAGLYRLMARLVPSALFHQLNGLLTRRGARRLSRAYLAAEYDRAHARTLRALERVAEADFARSTQYPGWDPLLAGEVSLERLFHYVRDHFEAHAAEIEARLAE